jgi:hypothetical protein
MRPSGARPSKATIRRFVVCEGGVSCRPVPAHQDRGSQGIRTLGPSRGRRSWGHVCCGSAFPNLCVRARATAETQPCRHFGGSDRSRADTVTGDKSLVLAIFPPDLRGVAPHAREACSPLNMRAQALVARNLRRLRVERSLSLRASPPPQRARPVPHRREGCFFSTIDGHSHAPIVRQPGAEIQRYLGQQPKPLWGGLRLLSSSGVHRFHYR